MRTAQRVYPPLELLRPPSAEPFLTSPPLRLVPSAGNPLANTVSECEANDQSDCNFQHCESRQLESPWREAKVTSP